MSCTFNDELRQRRYLDLEVPDVDQSSLHPVAPYSHRPRPLYGAPLDDENIEVRVRSIAILGAEDSNKTSLVDPFMDQRNSDSSGTALETYEGMAGLKGRPYNIRIANLPIHSLSDASNLIGYHGFMLVYSVLSLNSL